MKSSYRLLENSGIHRLFRFELYITCEGEDWGTSQSCFSLHQTYQYSKINRIQNLCLHMLIRKEKCRPVLHTLNVSDHYDAFGRPTYLKRKSKFGGRLWISSVLTSLLLSACTNSPFFEAVADKPGSNKIIKRWVALSFLELQSNTEKLFFMHVFIFSRMQGHTLWGQHGLLCTL